MYIFLCVYIHIFIYIGKVFFCFFRKTKVSQNLTLARTSWQRETSTGLWETARCSPGIISEIQRSEISVCSGTRSRPGSWKKTLQWRPLPMTCPGIGPVGPGLACSARSARRHHLEGAFSNALHPGRPRSTQAATESSRLATRPSPPVGSPGKFASTSTASSQKS